MDLVITPYCVGDCTDGGQITTIPGWYEMTVVDGMTMKNYFAHFDNITTGFSDEGYYEIRINRANVYRYTLGDTLNGVSVSDAFQMYEDVLNIFTGGVVPPPSSYYILAENGNILNAENSDKIRTETP